MPAVKSKDCSLCSLDGFRLYDDNIFSVVYCETHTDTPMAVLKRHTEDPTAREMAHIYSAMLKNFPGRKPRGIGMQSIPTHWHEHWIKK